MVDYYWVVGSSQFSVQWIRLGTLTLTQRNDFLEWGVMGVRNSLLVISVRHCL